MLPAGTCGRARRLPRRRRSTAASRDEASRDEALQVETRRDEAGRGVATKSRIVLTWSRVGDEKETKSTCVSMSPPGNPLRPFTCQPPPGEKKKRTDVLVPSCRVELSRWSPIASLDGLSHASAQTHLVVRTAPPPQRHARGECQSSGPATEGNGISRGNYNRQVLLARRTQKY